MSNSGTDYMSILEEEVEDKNPGDTNERKDEIVPSRAQDDASKVPFEEKQVVFEKYHNSVVGRSSDQFGNCQI